MKFAWVLISAGAAMLVGAVGMLSGPASALFAASLLAILAGAVLMIAEGSA